MQTQQREKLRAQIVSLQKQIDAKVAAQKEYAERMDVQGGMNEPELGFWEWCLGMRIEGSGDEGRVRVVYAFPPTAANAGRVGATGGEEGGREGAFELRIPETGSGGYEVTYTKPRLEREKVDRVVGRLNESRELGGLLKGMRALFAEELK
jgi:kinetochore protein Spc25, fungi type